MKPRAVFSALPIFLAAPLTCIGLSAQAAPPPTPDSELYVATAGWWQPGEGAVMPASIDYETPTGRIGLLNTVGSIETKGHPFFEPLGTNGRACVSCHQPVNGMSVSVGTLNARWHATEGKDPVFAAIDGSNCPSLAQDKPESHSLLLNRGLFRIALPWPPQREDGTPIEPEFTIEVVKDAPGCNTDPSYGLHSPHPTISVYRRPRMTGNLTFIVGTRYVDKLFSSKTGMPVARDPDTGKPVTMNLMSDARQLTLKSQAINAVITHEQGLAAPSTAQLEQLLAFEQQLYVAESFDKRAGNLAEPGGPEALGPGAMAAMKVGGLGDNVENPVFGHFDSWKGDSASADAQARFRASVARGSDVFFRRPIWIRDATYINSIGLGNPVKRTCSTCHNAQLTGTDDGPGWMDLGTANLPWAEKSDDLPLFKLVCRAKAVPHAYLGRVIYTHDPRRALITGSCADIGALTMQQFRGLAARAPYFSNGSAKDLAAVVDFYNRRFEAQYTEQEREDLANFLSVL
jgi:hypothetical protein